MTYTSLPLVLNEWDFINYMYHHGMASGHASEFLDEADSLGSTVVIQENHDAEDGHLIEGWRWTLTPVFEDDGERFYELVLEGHEGSDVK